MLISNQRLLNMPIVSLQTGAPLGRVNSAIIDPRQLYVVAFHAAGPRVPGSAILHTEDIREISSVGIIVDDAESLMPPDDLVRLKEVAGMRFTLIGKQVIDEHNRKLGKVEDYSIDVDSFYIMKMTVRQSLVRNFFGGTLFIDRSQIVEITDKHIVVQGADIKEPKIVRSRPIIENPFRKHETPQPNNMTPDEPRS